MIGLFSTVLLSYLLEQHFMYVFVCCSESPVPNQEGSCASNFFYMCPKLSVRAQVVGDENQIELLWAFLSFAKRCMQFGMYRENVRKL